MPLSILNFLLDLHQGHAVRSQKQTNKQKKKSQRSFRRVPDDCVCYNCQAAQTQIPQPKTKARQARAGSSGEFNVTGWDMIK